jgi:hypothetical protein
MPFSALGCTNPCMNFAIRFELFLRVKLTGSGKDFWTRGRKSGWPAGGSRAVWWVRDGEQDEENLGRRGGEGWVRLSGTGIPANKCKRDGEALPGSAVRYRAGGSGWSSGRAGDFMCFWGIGTQAVMVGQSVLYCLSFLAV